MTVTMEVTNNSVLNLLRDLANLNFIQLKTPVASPGETTGADWFENGGECPLCAIYKHEPNEETIAALEEGDAIARGEIPAKCFHTIEELLADLRS